MIKGDVTVIDSSAEKTYVEPDISVICDSNKLDDRGCKGAPDWIVEIVSPSSKQMDYYTKLFKYRTAGVREYWLVDPDKNLVLVYNFEHGTSEPYTLQDSVKAGIYEDLWIDFSNLRLDHHVGGPDDLFSFSLHCKISKDSS